MKKNVLMSVVLGISVMAAHAQDKLVMDGSTTVGPIAKAFAETYMRQNPGVNITVSESGSGNGAKALLNGTCDIANLSRHLKESEKKAMSEKGVRPVAHVVAYDALPVIVHPSNRVKGLTLDQIRDIYTGKITNWKEVGGGDQRIVVISRDTNSGTFETFKELVLGNDSKIVASAEYTGSNGGVRQRVQMTKGAIGYAGLGFVDRSVKALEVNGVVPSAESVIAKQYPISRELFMFTNGEPAADSLAAKLLGMSRSEKGREIIEEIGYVPVPEK
ncbi:MAG: phosphate ABC transporter substrate-binding protein [Lentisphaerae bacterium]|nr:phosphate ABC transporter substrate-binding protein [Lentisphaerota bacterium]